MIERLPIAGCGFLFCVLWFDLMFDSLVFGQPSGVLSQDVLDAIAAYYARVTTGADPMSSLVLTVMLVCLVAIARQGWQGHFPRVPVIVSFALVFLPVSLAVLRIVPNAIRLGTQVDPLEIQSQLARSIAYEHIACAISIAVALGLQLWLGGRYLIARPQSGRGSNLAPKA